MQFLKLSSFLLPLFFSVFFTGCNSSNGEEDIGPVGKLWGKVTFNSKKVLLGRVMVVTENGREGQGEINSEGIYLIEKAPAGKVSLFLELPELPPELYSISPGGDPQPPMPPDVPKPIDPGKEFDATLKQGFQSIANIPKSYTQPDHSGFQMEVKEGQENEYHLKMVSRPK